MNTRNSQLEQYEWESTSYPAKEKICSILGISFQSTHEEVLYAYKEQLIAIESLKPKDCVEQTLLQEKTSVLSDAYKAYTEEFNKKGTPDIASSVEADKRKSQKNTMYSFHIPCIFWCMFKGADCVWNCCCAGCSCCGDSYDCWSECYNEGGPCEFLRPVDTFIAIVGSIAGIIWLISKIAPSISDAASSASANRSKKKADSEKQKLIRNYQKDYLPKLTQAYEEWCELNKYNVDVRGFLDKLSKINTDEQSDAAYKRMQQEVNREYDAIEKRWEKLQVYLDDLKSTKNYYFYSYLRDEAPDRERYLEMFRSKRQPWHN